MLTLAVNNVVGLAIAGFSVIEDLPVSDVTKLELRDLWTSVMTVDHRYWFAFTCNAPLSRGDEVEGLMKDLFFRGDLMAGIPMSRRIVRYIVWRSRGPNDARWHLEQSMCYDIGHIVRDYVMRYRQHVVADPDVVKGVTAAQFWVNRKVPAQRLLSDLGVTSFNPMRPEITPANVLSVMHEFLARVPSYDDDKYVVAVHVVEMTTPEVFSFTPQFGYHDWLVVENMYNAVRWGDAITFPTAVYGIACLHSDALGSGKVTAEFANTAYKPYVIEWLSRGLALSYSHPAWQVEAVRPYITAAIAEFTPMGLMERTRTPINAPAPRNFPPTPPALSVPRPDTPVTQASSPTLLMELEPHESSDRVVFTPTTREEEAYNEATERDALLCFD
jgi:hypothetical protein